MLGRHGGHRKVSRGTKISVQLSAIDILCTKRIFGVHAQCEQTMTKICPSVVLQLFSLRGVTSTHFFHHHLIHLNLKIPLSSWK